MEYRSEEKLHGIPTVQIEKEIRCEENSNSVLSAPLFVCRSIDAEGCQTILKSSDLKAETGEKPEKIFQRIEKTEFLFFPAL